MSARRLALAAAACLALVLAAALLFRMSLEKALLLAPVIVATAGATAFIVVLWTKIAVECLRGQRHGRRIVAAAVAALAFLLVLSFVAERSTVG